MRTVVKAHGIDLSDELRTMVHHETERLAQALRRRINTVQVELYEEPGPGPQGYGARCYVNVLFEDGSSVEQTVEDDDYGHSLTGAFVKILCDRHRRTVAI